MHNPQFIILLWTHVCDWTIPCLDNSCVNRKRPRSSQIANSSVELSTSQNDLKQNVLFFIIEVFGVGVQELFVAVPKYSADRSINELGPPDIMVIVLADCTMTR